MMSNRANLLNFSKDINFKILLYNDIENKITLFRHIFIIYKIYFY